MTEPRITEPMHRLLWRISRWQKGATATHRATYMHYATEARTAYALEARGMLDWCRVDDGYMYNGYALTPAAHAYMADHPDPATPRGATNG